MSALFFSHLCCRCAGFSSLTCLAGTLVPVGFPRSSRFSLLCACSFSSTLIISCGFILLHVVSPWVVFILSTVTCMCFLEVHVLFSLSCLERGRLGCLFLQVLRLGLILHLFCLPSVSDPLTSLPYPLTRTGRRQPTSGEPATLAASAIPCVRGEEGHAVKSWPPGG